ncbi:hypothetical protein [Streptomyces sp. NPDC001222]|uniref:hypothetical protein n=1 Tax=Streptomyces sp. NPDC001222 TaxID=3364548 RepID=UPI0036BB4DBD
MKSSRRHRIVAPVHLRRGEPARAMDLHRHAHRPASAPGYRIEPARAPQGMSRAAEALGDATEADAHRRAAEELYDVMDVTEAGRHM